MRIVLVIFFAFLLVGCDRITINVDTQLPPENVTKEKNEYVRYDVVELEQALKWDNDKGVVWIDARSRKDYEKAHVEGAFLLNEMEDFYKLLKQIWSEIQDKADLPFIVYCSSESNLASRNVSEKLRETVGIVEVYVLEGGLKSLIDRGLIK
ncbi:rhodanese-like domain-containing protein [Verrucomicrobia bacterium]|nr:rhodanese-like domain-containing protein [Verrucomicrobiota bacterium]